jgi:hypothetical protein
MNDLEWRRPAYEAGLEFERRIYTITSDYESAAASARKSYDADMRFATRVRDGLLAEVGADIKAAGYTRVSITGE